MSTPQQCPLTWPVGVPRTTKRKRAPFGKYNNPHSIDRAYWAVRAEYERILGATALTISSNVPRRKDGAMYSGEGRIEDVGVAVYFRLNDMPVCLPCDKWDRVADNLWAIAKHIEAMRGMERWGVGTVEQQFLGYKALAAKSEERWYEVLGIPEDSNRATIEQAWRVLAQMYHPDKPNGSHDQMARINVARATGLETCK